MVIEKKHALYLLEESFQDKGLTLVHGTCAEAVIKMFETGKLPSALDPELNNYLYFIPKKQAFVNHQLYNKIDLDLNDNELEDMASGYAILRQKDEYIRRNFGVTDSTIIEELIIPRGLIDIYSIDQIRKYGILKFRKELNKRKGVIVGINENIFNFNIENGSDEPGKEVMIKLPNGLDISYVHHIYPCGDIEEDVLTRYIHKLKH